MQKVLSFIKKEIVLIISAILAIISMLFTPPSKEYLGYIDFSVIAILFCLMAVVAGLRSIGVFDFISCLMLKKSKSTKAIGIVLVAMCFFSAMLITNDVALLTFVPLTISIFNSEKTKNKLIFIVVIETVAANLGSMLTPIGNPQNLFLYSFYSMKISDFFKITLPLGLISLVLIFIIMLFTKGEHIESSIDLSSIKINKYRLFEYITLFILCILVVLKVLDYRICLGVVLLTLICLDRKLFARVDYSLLLTFVCFFVFVGNISAIGSVRQAISSLIEGKELLGSVLLSQVISNVPAAVMLSGFTEKSSQLLAGVNIGGLGTIIASLASLISYKLYSACEKAEKGKYMATFSLVNFIFLAVMLLVSSLILK
ncbi:MAG: anion permease [Clostridiales bacterium]|nr:anion permease [Clostridiales bacterium]